MYRLTKEIKFDAAHRLNLSYDSPCENMHGHCWKIVVTCECNALNKDGMVIDFKEIKNQIMELDHTILNEKIEQPTAENIAKHIYRKIPFCTKVKVIESEGSEVEYYE